MKIYKIEKEDIEVTKEIIIAKENDQLLLLNDYETKILTSLYQEIKANNLSNKKPHMLSNFNTSKTHQSNNTTTNNNQQHNQEIKHHLQLVFIYYSSFADRNNYHLLKQQNYRRFLIDSEMVKSATDFPEFDIMFKKISKGNSNAVNFEEFLKLLPEIACKFFSSIKGSLYKGENRQSAFKKFIKNDIKKLETEIREHSEFGQEVNIVESFLNRTAMEKEEELILKKLTESCMIRKSYEVYIGSTSMHQKSPSDTFESFYKFLKEFEISPQLIYKTICYVAFIILLMNKPEGTRQQFDIETFVRMIMILAEIITTKELSNSSSELLAGSLLKESKTDKICRVLERMEVSAGFEKMAKLIKGETYYSMSLVRLIAGNEGLSPYKSGNQGNEQDLNQPSGDKGSYSQRYRNYLFQNSNEKPSNSSYDSLDTLANEPQEYKQIKKIFEDLCSYGEVGNTKTLKSLKIKKLYNQLGLLKVLTQAWLDLTITELIRKSSTGKMEFLQFVELLNLTAKKLNIAESEMYNIVISNSRELLHQNNNNNNDLNSLTASSIAHYDEKELALCMEMLETISYPLERVFHFYSHSKNYISFTELSKLMYDFEIFPSIITKAKLYQIFSECYDQSLDVIVQNDLMKTPDVFLKDKYMSKRTNKYVTNEPTKLTGDPHLKEEKLMHISTFPLLMLKASNEICEEALSPPQKLIILLEKMHESKGQQKVVIAKGSLVSELRKIYPQVYKMSFGLKDQKPQEENIDDLLDNISEY